MGTIIWSALAGVLIGYAFSGVQKLARIKRMKNQLKIAREQNYFVERKLYPNVDFYSGIILQALGFPTDMFTVLFAIGRTPGWLAHWKEIAENGKKIHRPRQIYQGHTLRSYLELENR